MVAGSLMSRMVNRAMGDATEVVRKRIDQLGTREPSIERQGDSRIVVQVPGLSDPQHLVGSLDAFRVRFRLCGR